MASQRDVLSANLDLSEAVGIREREAADGAVVGAQTVGGLEVDQASTIARKATIDAAPRAALTVEQICLSDSLDSKRTDGHCLAMAMR
jgi:hypothetical protein